MKISSKTRYALKTVLDLAMHRNDGVCRVTQIAARQNIPQKFLEQILLGMKGAGIVLSKRGAKGGYYLAKPPSAISLATIIRLTEESLITLDPIKAEVEEDSPFTAVWTDINEYIVTRLEGISVQDVCTKAEEIRQSKARDFTI